MVVWRVGVENLANWIFNVQQGLTSIIVDIFVYSEVNGYYPWIFILSFVRVERIIWKYFSQIDLKSVLCLVEVAVKLNEFINVWHIWILLFVFLRMILIISQDHIEKKEWAYSATIGFITPSIGQVLF